jgi:hypothetical protein
MHPHPINTWTRRHNLVSERPGSKSIARNVNTVIKARALFFNNNVIQDITNFTNIYNDIFLQYKCNTM